MTRAMAESVLKVQNGLSLLVKRLKCHSEVS